MQSAPRSQPAWQKEHLWLALQALGFEAGAEATTVGKTLAHVTFGVNMFDKPNKDAFYVVFHFLFARLDSARCKEVFRYCWPPLDKKKDAEFRKASCEWLKKISEEVGSSFPQVVASIFLSPGGPKFVQLLYHFAKYVMLQHIKRDVDAENFFIPDALQSRIQDPQKSQARNIVARSRYLQTLQRENFVIKEYQSKTQLLVKEIRKLRSEFVSLQSQSRAQSVQCDNSKRDAKIIEVRSMWNSIVHTLKAVEKEMEVVDCVVGGDVDQFSLDGSNVTINIPSMLVTRIENEMYTLQLENVYEAGKVNFITIIQLLNEVLKLVKQENVHSGDQKFQVDLQYLLAKVKFETEILQRLKQMRHKIKREDIVSINKSIKDKEDDWDKKWNRFLGQSPFSLSKMINPVFELKSYLPSLSFEPASEEDFRNSAYNLYPASAVYNGKHSSVFPNKDSAIKNRKLSDSLSFLDVTDSPVFTPTERKSLPLDNNKITPSMRRLSLNENDFRTPNSNGNNSFALGTPTSAIHKRRSDTSWMTPASSLPHTPTPCEQDAKSAARLQLAQQVADYIVDESPNSASGRVMELEDLIGMLSTDPFLSRQEIPRTPENLISDIRTSWREAIQTEEFSNVSSPLEVQCVESPAEPESAHCSQIDLSMACFLSTSHFSEQNESPGSPIAPSDLKPSFQEATPCHSMLQISTSELRTENSENLKQCEDSGMFSPFVEKDQTPLLESQSSRKIVDSTIHLSHQPENASAQTTLSWNSSNVADYNSGLDSHEEIQFGILHETLPVGAGNVSLNSTTSLETPEAHRDVPKGDQLLAKPSNSTERKMDFNSIRSRYEALKKTFSASLLDDETEHYQVPLRKFEKHKSESSLVTDSENVFSPLDKGLALNLECLMTPSPKGRKLSLPQLISFSPAEDAPVQRTEELAVVFDSRGPRALNETIDLPQPAVDLQESTDEDVEQLIKL
ncbi:HAUS augmin-like complex subunit 6 [Anomaloglossus baeobatrachus]|uniref:HAUS augmin-like complex subunit 6 n=1 Tax=Anomaloglossus baeobatrachus TaxID=238106 RepID=UPI003F4F72BA